MTERVFLFLDSAKVLSFCLRVGGLQFLLESASILGSYWTIAVCYNMP